MVITSWVVKPFVLYYLCHLLISDFEGALQLRDKRKVILLYGLSCLSCESLNERR